MSFDPLLALLGLTAFASPTDPVTYAPTVARAALRIAPAALPSTPGIGDLAIDSGASNALKWWDGSAWQAAGGGGAPGGADTQLQFNDGGAFGGDSSLTWDKVTKQLSISTTVDGYESLFISRPVTTAGGGGYAAAGFLSAGLTVNADTDGSGLYVQTGTILANVVAGAGYTAAVVDDATTLQAGLSIAPNQGAGQSMTVTEAYALESYVNMSAGTDGTVGITRAAVIDARGTFSDTGGALSVTDAYGVRLRFTTNGGTPSITNLYGVHIGSYSGTATNRYGIFQADPLATNVLKGSLRFDGSTSGSTTIQSAAVAGGTFTLTLPTTAGSPGNFLSTDGSGVLSWAAAAGGTPAGSDTQIQYNNAGAFGASSSFTYSAALGRVTITRTTDLANSIAFYITKTAPAAGATAGNYYGMYSNLTHSPNVGETNALILRPLYSEAVRQGSNASSIPSYSLIGGGFAAKNEGTTGTIGGATGVSINVITAAGTTTTTATGVSSYLDLSGASTTAYFLRVLGSGAGAIGTAYGLHIDYTSMSTVTTRYGVYQLGTTTLNYFQGVAGVGIAPAASTQLNLAAGTTAISSMRIPHGAAPSAPVAGDIWATNADGGSLYYRNGSNTTALVYHINATCAAGTLPAWDASGGTKGRLRDAPGLSYSEITGGRGWSIASGNYTGAISTGTLQVDSTPGAISGDRSAIAGNLSPSGAVYSGTMSGLYGYANAVLSTAIGNALYNGVRSIVNFTGNAINTTTNTMTGVRSEVTFTYSGDQAVSGITGDVAGVTSQVTYSFSAGAAVNAVSIANTYGLWVKDLTFNATSAGRIVTLTNYYGLYLGTTPADAANKAITNRYGIYQADALALNYFAGDVQIADKNIILGTTTGTKIGTATTQKLGFFNSAPIVQPNSTGETVGFTAGAGTTVTDQSTFTGNVGATAYRLSDIVKHLKNLGLIAA